MDRTRQAPGHHAQAGVYLLTIGVLGNAALVALLTSVPLADLRALAASAPFWSLLVLTVLAQLPPVHRVDVVRPPAVATSTTLTFAALVAFGLPVAVGLQAVASIITRGTTGTAWWRTGFNLAQYVVSLAAAHAVLVAGGMSGSMLPQVPRGSELPVVLAAALTYFAVNTALVWVAVALSERRPLADVVGAGIAHQAGTQAVLLGLAPLVVTVAAVAWELLALFLVPLALVQRHAVLVGERSLRERADALTGLPNRTALSAHVDAVLRRRRAGEGPSALLLLGLDRFRQINDTLGRPCGDGALCTAAVRLGEALPEGVMLARTGSEEFAVLLSGLSTRSEASAMAHRLRETLARPLDLEGVQVSLEASVGIAFAPDHGEDVDGLFRRANVAMYLAATCSTGVEVYRPERDVNSPERLGLLASLRAAVDNGELELRYQPKVSTRDGSVVGVEALVRWRHPVRGLVMPDDFIPLAEESGCMQRVTAVVIEQALEAASGWWRSGLKVPVAVNVSMRDLVDPEFAGRASRALIRHGLPPSALVLEITERVLMAEPDRVFETLTQLGLLGVSLSLDDFGTGYSSLALLKRLPVREIKIDQSFVRKLGLAGDDDAIVRSIVDLGHALGMVVVAEGVETSQSWDRLVELGCDVAQGFVVARPLAGPEVTAWLHVRSRPEPTVALRLVQG